MLSDNWRNEVLDLAERYCKAHGIMRTTLAARIVKDADYFDHIESGGGCNVATLENVRNWFAANLPAPPTKNTKRRPKGT